MNQLMTVMFVAALALGVGGTVRADSKKAAFTQQGLSAADMADLLGTLPTAKPSAREEDNPVILKALAGLKWGMTSQEVIVALAGKGELDLATVRNGYVSFDGQVTEWEGTPIASQYTHGNGEAMLVVEDGGLRKHFFFIQDKLWKYFEAAPKKDSRGNFHSFSRVLRHRFGAGHVHTAGEAERWIEFGSKRTRVRGLDGGEQPKAYGVVFEDRPTLAKLSTMRVATVKPVRMAPTAPVVLEPTVPTPAEVLALNKAIDKAVAAESNSKGRPAAAAAKVRAKQPAHRELDAMAQLEDDDPLTGL